jgi:ADP-heptose:LPS heptosyltransferase
MILKIVKFIAQKPISSLANFLLKSLNIYVIYRIGKAIGDQLCMTAVIRLIDEQHPFKIIVISSYPEIFYNNPRIWKCFGVSGRGLYLSRILRFLSGARLENFLFTNNKFSQGEYLRSKGRKLHLVQANSLHFNCEVSYTEIQNEIYFSQLEIKRYEEKFNFPKPFSIIQPNSKLTFTPNKQWDIVNFQKVVDHRSDIFWIQVGNHGEFLLKNVNDYRSRTSLRELFFIVSKSQFVLANEGLINHIASAFNVKSYVLLSGFSDRSLANYRNSVFFESQDSCSNSPCWLLKECGVNGKPCLSNIDSKIVAYQLS